MSVVSPHTPLIHSALGQDGLTMAFQPIVELATGRTVGYEALARGPRGTPLESPAVLFALAERDGELPQLDRACRKLAIERALEVGLDPELLLFLNVEPAGLDSGGVLDRMAERELGRISVVVELTERALASRPREVLAAVRWLRRRNCRIALDDVGADPRSMALMPFVAPDVIKLDLAIVQERMPAIDTARIVNAVGAQAERSGATILAEGIETEEHLRRASAIGATLGQGWLLGRPGPLDAATRATAEAAVSRRPAASGDRRTPFHAIAKLRAPRRGDKRLLLAMSRQLEQEAMGLEGEVVVLSTFQSAGFFSRLTRERYERLARRAALVGALGVGMGRSPGGKVRGAALKPDDALRGEWDVIVVSPHFAGAFVARDLGDDGPDLERRFDYSVTYDRELVTDAARRLLSRIIPSGGELPVDG